MRKFTASALAAVTFVGAVAAAAPASADRRHHRHHRGGGGDEVAAAIIGGVAGLALGAALSGSSSRRGTSHAYYGNGYAYDPRQDGYYGGYYARPYAGYPPPVYRRRTCSVTERVYDPYVGRRMTIERRYAC